MDLVGSVHDSDVIIVDDMIDTAGTLCKAASVLKEFGGEESCCWRARLRSLSNTCNDVCLEAVLKSRPQLRTQCRVVTVVGGHDASSASMCRSPLFFFPNDRRRRVCLLSVLSRRSANCREQTRGIK